MGENKRKDWSSVYWLQDEIYKICEDAIMEKDADPDLVAAMLFGTADALGLLHGDTWFKDRLDLFKYELEHVPSDPFELEDAGDV